MFNIAGTLLSSAGNLASTWLDGKVAANKAEAQIRLKEATGDIDWDLAAIRATQSSWKDEWVTVLFSIPLVLSFCGEWGRVIVANGFEALSGMPQWYQVSLGAVVAASLGTKGVAKFFGPKKK
jgi:hypothetical protein|tara:strand:+ start:108 stop:476 length:369 start_codon:yes stop_codon:yes gene_type:complete